MTAQLKRECRGLYATAQVKLMGVDAGVTTGKHLIRRETFNVYRQLLRMPQYLHLGVDAHTISRQINILLCTSVNGNRAE